jgi:acetyl esterase/lipase
VPIFHRLDPELTPAIVEGTFMDLTDIPAARVAYLDLMGQVPAPDLDPALEQSDHWCPGAPGDPDVRVRVFRPRRANRRLPCVYWIQGGGHVLTAIDLDDPWCQSIALQHDCVVTSVEWRRSPEHPFPAEAEDCYAGLRWVVDHADVLGVDPSKIVVAGESSGGGSAATLALMVRDRGELAIEHQVLICPMLDDTNSTPSSYAVTDEMVWNRERNEIAWRAYLGAAYGSASVPAHAAPARMADLSGLAPATVFTAALDLFVDEDIEYARRLIHADVPTELHVYPGAQHGFYRMFPGASVSLRFRADFDGCLRRALGTPTT